MLAGIWPGDEAARLERLIIGYGLAGLPYLFIWWHWRDWAADRDGLVRLLVMALLARVVLLVLPPLLSEDVWRYVWDGAVQWAGHNPYRHAPADPALDALAAPPALAAIRGQIGHAHIPTIYPPAAQLTFLAASVAGPSTLILRALMALADVLLVGALWRWAQRTDRPPQVALLYAFAPLPILEGAVGGHIDVAGAAATILAGAWLAAGRFGRPALALAYAIGVKFLPILALPTLLRAHRRTVALTLLAVALLAVPYLGAGQELLDGLRAYGHRWRANEGLFAVLAWPFELWWPPSELPVDLPPVAVRAVRTLVGDSPGALPHQVWPDEVAFAAAKATAIGLFGLLCLQRWWAARDLETSLGPILVGLFLVAPVLHPWYLVWALPFAVLGIASRRWWAHAVLIWSLLAWTAYLPRPDYLRTGEWSVDWRWRLVEYVPVWAALLVGAVKRVRSGRRAEIRRSPASP
ncbi:MAG: DUF2029 domain-containing protein [Myxococcales bacterium]|nr:DUF2029 domain-containing protein [Myxococcales bacterium]